MPWIVHRTAIAFDPSFIPKSGNQTPGIGYFWSGCAGRALRGIGYCFTIRCRYRDFSACSPLTQTQSKIVNMSMNYCFSAQWPLNF